jgi:hypothetical protein
MKIVSEMDDPNFHCRTAIVLISETLEKHDPKKIKQAIKHLVLADLYGQVHK